MAEKDFMGPNPQMPEYPWLLNRPSPKQPLTSKVPPQPVQTIKTKLENSAASYRPDFLRGSNDKVRDIDAFPRNDYSGPISSAEEYTLDFKPNVLDQFDTYTYHWKLFITSLEDASSGKVLSDSGQTIIAETGVTDLTIDKVEIQGIAVPSVEAGTGTQTLVKFEITEPAGAGLLDKMYYQSLALGIGNWLVMPCFLELTFKGRDNETAESGENGEPGALAGLRWIWPLKLTNSKVNVTEVGTRYEFDAIIYNELAQSDSYFGIQHNIVLTELSNVRSALAELEKKLNDDQWGKLVDNYGIPDSYRIIVDDNIAIQKFNNSPPNKSTARGSSAIDFNTKTASFNPGTSIDRIIDLLLGNTDYFQKKLQSSTTRSSTPKSANEMDDQMKQMWRIVTETRPIGFDVLRQDNAVEVTIYVVEYNIGGIAATPSQVGGSPETLPASRKRVAEYANHKILNKMYNYTFTGLNDQIINLDLNLNFAFAAALSRFGGIYYDTAGRDIGVSYQEYADTERVLTAQTRRILELANDPQASPEHREHIINKQIEELQKSVLDESVINKQTILLRNYRQQSRLQLSKDLRFRGFNNKGMVAKETHRSSIVEPTSNGKTFISDVNLSKATKDALNIAQASNRGRLRPIPGREGLYESNIGVGMDPTSDAARARTSSVFSTALYSTLDASLQVLKFTIKGDPYWLFPRNLPKDATGLTYLSNLENQQDAIAEIKLQHIKFPQSVNLYGTDNFLVIRLRTPRIFNETTTADDPYTEVETFSGVYKVVTITSKFEMGKFTQELMCILDPMINLNDFLRDVENSLKSVPTTENQPNPIKENIPDTAKKLPKIMGDAGSKLSDALTTRVATLKGTNIGSNIPLDIGLNPVDIINRRIL